jgi:protein-S-isoprenylcysteine O-methyltransferase Ste14
MDTEKIFNAIFWTLFVLMFLMRFWFGFRVWRMGERIGADRAAREREGFWALNLDRLFTLLVAAVGLLWLQGNSLRSLAFAAPDWLRGTGVGLGITSLGLFAWTHAVLGRFWSSTLQLRAGHQLITVGPYTRVRHPMYSAILGWLMSLGLVAANWTSFVLAALGTLIVLIRTRREEKMMLEQFGDDYREYMERTGRLLPLIRNLQGAQKRQHYAFLGCLLLLLLLIAIFFFIPHV